MPQPQPPAPGGGAVPNFRKKKGKGKARANEDEYSSGRQQPLQKPPDQEKLTEQELKEEFVRNLNSADPLKARNLARWDYQERCFVPYVEPEGIIILFQMDSELLGRDGRDIAENKAELIDDISDKETEEAVEKDGPKGKAPPLAPTLKKKEDGAEEPKDAKAGGKERAREEEPAPDEEEKEETEAAPTAAPSKPKKLLNQFNFCERACQTATNWPRDHGCQTEEPVRSQFKDQCNQWIIYDAYAADHDNRPKETKAKGEGAEEPEEGAAGAEEKKAAIKDMKKDKEGGKLIEREKVKVRKQSILDGQAAVDASLLRSSEVLKILERLAASNAHDGALMDFKYFEDNSDDYREKGEGTLLPLWRFVYEKAKKKHVTSISWSVTQPDMFAVSYGSFSFIHPVANGLVVVYSLRNTNFPEHIWMGPKGAMSCHIHPERNCLICIGLVDGNVAVLNLEKDENNETTSQVLKNVPSQFKHSCPVWSVKWGQDDIDGNPVFYSGGMDGRVLQWTLDVPDLQGLGGLIGAEIATLTLPIPPVSGPDGTLFNLFGCARVLAFHPVEKTNFLVGTAEGKIFRTSSLYGGRVQQIYDAHFLPVAALQWNHYHHEVFISCSEDWTIKVWDRGDPEPMFVFEIGVPILDVCWAPYSSTVFGAVTGEGKVLVFDLNASREKPCCTQQVVTKKKVHPHRIEFNPSHPIIVVGDDRGSLITLKLSPNLRVLPKDTRGIYLEGDAKTNFEVNKLVKILKLVRDPPIVTTPKTEELPTVTNLHEIPGALSRNYEQ